MALRHFKRRIQHLEDSEDSVNNDSELAIPKQDEVISNESESDEESSDDSDTSSSDDNGTLVSIQRPQFLSKSKRQKVVDSVGDREVKRRYNLSERIKQDNQASEAREKSEEQLKANFGTDDELIRRIMLLDDNDSVNPEKERQEWLDRCATRKKLRREALIAKQIELEQYEAKKLSRGRPISSEDRSGIEKDEIKPKSAKNASVFSNGPNHRWKPSKAQNPKLSQSKQMPEGSEETEYSYI